MARLSFSAIRQDRLEALYTVALTVGLRQGEALGLRTQDVNLEAGAILVRQSSQKWNGMFTFEEVKTDKSRRTIKLPDVCVAALRTHLERQYAERQYIGVGWENILGLVFTKEDGSSLSRHAVSMG